MIFKENLLQRPISILMAFGLAVLIGFVSFFQLPLSLMPDKKSPWVSIIIEYPGMTAEKIETIVTKPVEEKICVLPGIERVYSVSEEGKCRLNIRYQSKTETESAILDLRESVELARTVFPREVQEPLIIRHDPSETPVMILILEHPKMDNNRLRTFAESRIKPRFQRVDGVSEIFLSGGAEEEIRVEVDSDRLYARNLDIQDLFREIQFANVRVSSGKIRPNSKDIQLSLPWKFTNIEDIERTSVSYKNSPSIIRVHEVANVIRSGREKDSISRINGKHQVVLYLQKAGTANLITLSKNIRKEISQIKKDHTGLQIHVKMDQATPVLKALNQAGGSVLWGACMAFIVLLLFLRTLSHALLVALAIPLSIIISFSFFYLKGMGLNVLTISGLALVAGMLVDNSIIILESVRQSQSISNAVNRMEKAVLASTLTTVAVFLPVVFLSQENRILYGDITLAILFTLMVSLFASLILLPVLLNTTQKMEFVWHRFEEIKRKILPRISSSLDALVKSALQNPRTTFALSFLLVLLALIFLPYLKQEYIDPIDSPTIHITVELPPGSDLHSTEKKVIEIEDRLFSLFPKQIKDLTSRVEKAHAFLVLERNPSSKINGTKFIRSAQNALSTIHGCDIIFSEPDAYSAGSGQNEIEITFTGPDSDLLKQLCRDVASRLQGIPSVRDIIFHFKESGEIVDVRINREKAALLGFSVHKVADTLREMLHGPVTSKFFDDERQIDIRVMLAKTDRSDALDLQGLFLRNSQGGLVPLRAFADIGRAQDTGKITRLDRNRCVSMSVRYEGMDLNRMVRILEKRMERMVFPKEVRYELGENARLLAKNRKEMILAILFSLLLVFMVMAGIMENLFMPLLILGTIPLSLAAVVITLFVTRSSLNISVYIGLVMLSGIVVNNGILFVEAIKEQSADFFSPALKVSDAEKRQLILHAVRSRIRPVMMTTLTTVAGLLPILFSGSEGNNLWRPLALTVIAGLGGGTLLNIILFPVLLDRAAGGKRSDQKGISCDS